MFDHFVGLVFKRLNYRPYKTPQALGKAVNQAILSLPQSPPKKQHNVLTLANKVGCSSSQSPKGTHQKDKALSKKTKAAVFDLYDKSDMTQKAPGKRDRIIRRVSRKKEYTQKKYFLCTLREAHSIYLQTKPQFMIGFSTFCKLRPDHVHVFGKIPENVCLPSQ